MACRGTVQPNSSVLDTSAELNINFFQTIAATFLGSVKGRTQGKT